MEALLPVTEGHSADLEPVTGRPADQNPALVYLGGLGTGGQRTMREALNTIAGFLTGGRCDVFTLPWGVLRFQHVAAVRARLAERYAPATANKMLAALRGALRAAWRLGQMSAEDYQRAADCKGIRGETLPRGRALSSGELRALCATCGHDPTPAGARDAALIAVMYGGGLRRAEAVALDLAHVNPETGALTVRAGKGHKDRLAYLTGGALDALQAWLRVRGEKPGRLFWQVAKGGHMIPRGLTGDAVYKMLAKRAKEAGVRDFSPHDLRRTFVSDLLDAGADLSTARQMAGHANIQTTARYDRRGEAAKQKAAGLLHFPYVPATK